MHPALDGPSFREENGWEDEEAFDDDEYAEPSESESSEDISDEEEVVGSRSNGKGKGKEREITNAEQAVDQDFDRLVRDLRTDDGSTSALSKVWDFDMKDRDAEFKDDLREASGVGKKRGRKPGRQKGVNLSLQVKALIGEGNQAYVDNNIPETIRILEEVIRIEPRAGTAWSVLAQCYEDLGDRQKALQLRIMAAHLNQDPEEWERLAEESKMQEYYQQALYCYRKLYQLDPANVNALWDRASLAKDIGDLRTARHSLLAILKQIPCDLTVLAEVRPILIELDDLELCEKLFEEAFIHYQTVFPNGQVPPVDQAGNVTFGLLEVLVLADLHNTLTRHEKAVETIRRGCRWLQGRSSQKFWDAIEDDREWDLPAGPNRESARVVSDGEVQPGMYPLDVNARHRLAIARVKMGDIVEGKMHANIILSQDIMEYAALFAEIADAYFERDMFAEARHVYDILGADERTSSMYVLLQAAACRRMTGDLEEAAKVYEHAIKADPENNDAKMRLAEIYEILNDPRRALELVTQVIDSRRRARRQQDDSEAGPSVSQPGASLFEEKARPGKDKNKKSRTDKLSAAELRELEAKKEQEAARSYSRVKTLWAQMLAGDELSDREWMHEAESLVEQFQETRALYLTSKTTGFRGVFPHSGRKKQGGEANEENMASRLQLDIGRESITRKGKGKESGVLDTFRTIKFDDWLRIFVQYSFNLTRRDRYPEAKDILEHIMHSNAFQKRTYLDSIRCALIACSIRAEQYDVVVEQSRKLINIYQFNNEPYRILLASLGKGLRATDSFLASTLAKHLLRELRAWDTAFKNPESLRWNANLNRFRVSGSKAEDEDEAESAGETSGTQRRVKLPSKENPIGVALYGQICLAAKSYQSAIFYLLHAYDYCPHDPVICLCLAVASIGRAMQRQADNRQHLITQAMAFLSRYRALRSEEMPQEVEYNFGRAFHHLGLMSLAVKHYERVLEQTEVKLRSDPHADLGLAREAAYNLSIVYVSTGATPLAQDLYRRWLSL